MVNLSYSGKNKWFFIMFYVQIVIVSTSSLKSIKLVVTRRLQMGERRTDEKIE